MTRTRVDPIISNIWQNTGLKSQLVVNETKSNQFIHPSFDFNAPLNMNSALDLIQPSGPRNRARPTTSKPIKKVQKL